MLRRRIVKGMDEGRKNEDEEKGEEVKREESDGQGVRGEERGG